MSHTKSHRALVELTICVLQLTMLLQLTLTIPRPVTVGILRMMVPEASRLIVLVLAVLKWLVWMQMTTLGPTEIRPLSARLPLFPLRIPLVPRVPST